MRTITALLTPTLLLISTLSAGSLHDPGTVVELPDIARLHTCIEIRFIDRTTFGMKRVLPREHQGIRDFSPETSTEQSIMTALAEKGYEVALYLSGRGVLTNAPVVTDPLLRQMPTRRYLPQGPAFITKITNTADLPPQAALLAAGRAGFAALDQSEAYAAPYAIKSAGWTIAMRPLRANATCIACHAANPVPNPTRSAGLRDGDVLGVAMYVYRKH
jgi:mono/diheme cytochrome c family protein